MASAVADYGETGGMDTLDTALAAQFDRIDFLGGLRETTFFELEDGATSFVDDLALDPLGASALSEHAITATAELLQSARVLAVRDAPSAVSAFALLRSALEASCAAIWLLEPDDRDERMRRALRRHWSDLVEAEAMSRALTGVAPDRGTDWARAHARWFVGVAPDAARAPVDPAATVAAAAEVVEAFTEVPGAAAIITSGWAGFGSVAIARHPADGEMFAGSLSMVLDVAETAISLFHARATASSAQPDDAPTLAHLRGR